MVEENHPQIELLNSKFTRNAGEFIIKYVSLNMNCEAANDTPNEEIYRLDLSDRDIFRVDKEALLSLGIAFENVRSMVLQDTDLNHPLANPFLEQF